MTPRPLIPRLSPNVVNIDEGRAWLEFKMAVKVVQDLADQYDKPRADDKDPETEVRE